MQEPDAEPDPLLAEAFTVLDEDPDGAEPALLARHPNRAEDVRRALSTALAYLAFRARRFGSVGEIALAPGALLGDFEIERELARGGMGVVYRARQRSLGGRPVALKVQPAAPASDPRRTRFEREAKLLARLHHPSLAEVYAHGYAEGLSFIAMRLIEGRTWAQVQMDLARTDPAPDERARTVARRRDVRLVAEVAQALAVAHAAGIVHRDVKPSNIVLEPSPAGGEPRAVLVDFGLARAEDLADATRTASLAPATAAYAAPEQLDGRGATARSDVFCLGVMLHDLLSGQGPSARGQASAGLGPLGEVVPGADRNLCWIVDRAVEREPARRPADAGELARELEAWLAGSAAPSRIRRARRTALGAAAACAALALVAALWIGAGVSRVQAGERRAEPIALARAVLGAPGPARRLAGWGGPGSHPALALLAAERVEEGLLEAARDTALYGRDDPCGDLLLAELSARKREDERLIPLRLLARLFYERSDWTAAESETSERYRAVLEGQWKDPHLGEEERAFAAAALSGCGGPSSFALLTAWAGSGLESEAGVQVRHALERIVRRGHGTGWLGSLPLADAWPLVEASLTSVDSNGLSPNLEFEVPQAGWRLGEALQIARRACGEEPFALPECHYTRQGRTLSRGDTLNKLCVLSGDRATLELLESLASAPEAVERAHELGHLSELCGDADRAGRMRAALAALPGPASTSALGAFDAGGEEARLKLRGIVEEQELDSDTLLTSPPLPSDLVLLPAAGDPRPAGRSLARWTFGSEVVLLAGGAETPSGRGASLGQEGVNSTYLRLGQAGQASLVLPFKLTEQVETVYADLHLHHRHAARHCYPRGGDARIRVLLDGSVQLGEMLVASKEDIAPILIPIRAATLDVERPHTFEIQLLSTSLAPYWLMDVELTPQNP